MIPPNVGQITPDITLLDEHDQPVPLSDLRSRAERGVVLAFLRQYG